MPGGVLWQLRWPVRSARCGLSRALPMALAPEDATTVSDGMIVSLNARPHLYVCVSCRRRGAAPVAEGEQTDGRRLYDALKSLADGMGQDAPVQVVPTLCFANCERGCSGPHGAWKMVLPCRRARAGACRRSSHLCHGLRQSEDRRGASSGRPASLQTSVIARFPAPFEPAKDAAE